MPTTRSTCRSLESSSIRWSASPQSNPLEGAADICVEGSYRYWTGAIVALFTQRPRRGILRSSALRRSKKFAPNRSRWHHAYGGKGWPAGFSKGGPEKEVTPYATYSCSSRSLGAVLDQRGISRLGVTWLPYRPRSARAVPRAVLQGRPRPRRCAVDTLARLLPSPRPDRLL